MPPEPQPPPHARRFLALPFFGIHSYRNSEAVNYGPGLRLGTLLGGRISDAVSLNAEIVLEAGNLNNNTASSTYSEWTVCLDISPLWQFSAGRFQVAYGPKLGVYGLRGESHDLSYGVVVRDQKAGFVGGVNAGAFVPISPQAWLGLLLSFEVRWRKYFCEDRTNFLEHCDVDDHLGTPKVLGIAAAALF